MTILQFQQLYYITKSTEPDIDKSIKMVGAVTGMTPDQVERLPMKRFNKLCAKITKTFEVLSIKLNNSKPKQYVYVNRHIYKLHYRIDRQPINAGKYVEAVTFGKDIVENLHKIMATIAEPINIYGKTVDRPHDEIAKDFESMEFEAAYHAAVFFYTHFSTSMILIQPYLIKELTQKGMNPDQAKLILNASQQILDGFTMPKWSLNLREYLLNRFGG